MQLKSLPALTLPSSLSQTVRPLRQTYGEMNIDKKFRHQCAHVRLEAIPKVDTRLVGRDLRPTRPHACTRVAVTPNRDT